MKRRELAFAATTLVVAAVALAASSCVEVPKVSCGALECPAGHVCVEGTDACAPKAAVDACADIADGDSCALAGLDNPICSGGVCRPPGCGDGVLSAGEDCDNPQLLSVTDCREVGFNEPGLLGCNFDCTFDEAMCTGFCGDDVINGLEDCDGAAEPLQSCVDLGFDLGRTGCTDTCQVEVAECSRIGWHEQPVEFHPALAAVWHDDTRGYAVARNGQIVERDGDGWRQLDTGLDLSGEGFSSAWGSGDSFFAATLSGAVVAFDGTTWTKTAVSAGALLDISGSSPTFALTVAADGTVFSWNGTVWSASTIADSLSRVAVASETSAFAAGSIGGASVLLEFDGSVWTEVAIPGADPNGFPPFAIFDVWVTGDDLFVSSTTGVNHRSGAMWQPDTPIYAGVVLPSPTVRYVGGSGPNNVFLLNDLLGVDSVSRVQAWHYDGSTWVEIAFLPRALKPAHFSVTDASALVPIDTGGEGAVASFEGVGAMTGTPNFVDLHGVDGHSRVELFAAGSVPNVPGLIPQSAYGHSDLPFGDDWTLDIGSLAIPIRGIWSASPTSAAGVGKGLFVSYDGVGWTETPLDPTYDLRAIVGTSETDIYLGGSATDTGAPLLVHYDGNQYTPQTVPSGLEGAISALGLDGNDVVAVTTAGQFARVVGPAEVIELSSGPLNALFVGSSTNISVAGDFGFISNFDGSTWSQIEIESFDDFVGIDGTGANDVFVLGERGDAFQYDGVRWTPLRLPLPSPDQNTVRGICVLPDAIAIAGDRQNVVLTR